MSKVVRYRTTDGTYFGIQSGDLVHRLTDLSDGDGSGEIDSMQEIELLPLVGVDSKIVCVGINYYGHAAELGRPTPTAPLLFAKLQNTPVRAGELIRIPPITGKVDYEAELAVVIGKTAQRVSNESALDYVFGYTCVNDVTARDIQFEQGQLMFGKSLDTFCPIGPWITTVDEIPNPQALRITCSVNDELLQDASTADMIFSVSELVSHISQGITLSPGDVVSTGTPSGIGHTRTPPRYLKPGDTVTVEIEGIGQLTNNIAHA